MKFRSVLLYWFFKYCALLKIGLFALKKHSNISVSDRFILKIQWTDLDSYLKIFKRKPRNFNTCLFNKVVSSWRSVNRISDSNLDRCFYIGFLQIGWWFDRNIKKHFTQNWIVRIKETLQYFGLRPINSQNFNRWISIIFERFSKDNQNVLFDLSLCAL